MGRMPVARAGASRSAVGRAAPLSAARLRVALGGAAENGPGDLWADLRVVAETGSTSSDVLTLARAGAPEGLVIAAETQTAGRGRQGRTWVSLPGASLTFSALLRPRQVPPSARGWVPLLVGVAVVAAVREITGIGARLKWPNDVLIGERKLAGILAEQDGGAGDAIVVGIGLNVLGAERDLHVPGATSLQAHGVAQVDRAILLAAILRQTEHWYLRWTGTRGDADGCGLRGEYVGLSATVGQRVRVDLPGGQALAGTAVGIDGTGRLLVEARRDGKEAADSGPATDDAGPVAVSSGDVIHVR
jgi:BirA family transcriptional regulator, biotin operon repressor / biotin---[acetyl-CoA-carboxylase] ligase